MGLCGMVHCRWRLWWYGLGCTITAKIKCLVCGAAVNSSWRQHGSKPRVVSLMLMLMHMKPITFTQQYTELKYYDAFMKQFAVINKPTSLDVLYNINKSECNNILMIFLRLTFYLFHNKEASCNIHTRILSITIHYPPIPTHRGELTSSVAYETYTKIKIIIDKTTPPPIIYKRKHTTNVSSVSHRLHATT